MIIIRCIPIMCQRSREMLSSAPHLTATLQGRFLVLGEIAGLSIGPQPLRGRVRI